ncbi:MAG: class I SAM-dependent methyltransferase [Clostridiales Family XIII bacterium]|nr:class I SAM-dependent methyltransferase [Clostridiales Family XIII bacterium]
MDKKTMELSVEYYQELWDGKRAASVGHSPEIWDGRAEEWIAEIEDNPPGKLARVLDTADFLRSRGLLTPDTSAIDVGCGPGLFVAEFAKTAGSAVGLDFSRRFVGYAGDKAHEAGLSNAQYEYCDFTKDDTSRFEGRFDLAFSSITPATSTWELMKKFMRLSRAFCCNVSFLNVKDSLAEQISHEVFGEDFRPRWDGTGFYALLNIIWLSGYYPEIHYYDDVRDDVILPLPEEADYFAGMCRHNDSDAKDQVLRWLKSNGEMPCHRETRYGLILWDTRRKDKR